MTGQLWTDEENRIITDARAAGLKYHEICTLLPNRALRSIAVQGAKLNPNKGYRFWTEEEIETLIILRMDATPYAECAIALDRSLDSVKKKGAWLIKNGLIEKHVDMLLAMEETGWVSPDAWKKEKSISLDFS